MKGSGSAIAIAIVLAVAILLAGGVDACDNVPTMTRDDACAKACPSQALVDVCHATLKAAPASAEVTVYAAQAAEAAVDAYDGSVGVADRLLQNEGLPGDEKAAYVACKDKYAAARSNMVGVHNQLVGCSYAYARQELVDAMFAVQACGNWLANFTASPLYDANAADQGKTNVATELGDLIVGK